VLVEEVIDFFVGDVLYLLQDPKFLNPANCNMQDENKFYNLKKRVGCAA